MPARTRIFVVELVATVTFASELFAAPPAQPSLPAAPPATEPPVAEAPAIGPSNEPLTLREVPPPKPRTRKGIHEHDGFYFRGGLGFSGFTDTIVSEASVDNVSRDQGYVSGFSTVAELAAGGTLGRGFVLGGGFYSATVETPFAYDVRGRPIPAEFRRPDTFSVLGVMGDLYPQPRNGFHVQAALGLATLSGQNPGSDVWNDLHVAFGVGAMLGVGYEWWVGDQWSVGIIGRATVGVLPEDDATGARWFHLASAWPSVLFGVTYH